MRDKSGFVYQTVIVLITIISAFACQKTQENTNISISDASNNAINSEQQVEAVSYEDQDIRITSAYLRVAPKNGMTAGYLTIKWLNNENDSLLSINSSIALNHEIHETYNKENGMMGMRQIKGIALQSSNVAVLKPGGQHLMIMQLKEDLVEGMEYMIELNFAQKESINVKFPVKSLIAD